MHCTCTAHGHPTPPDSESCEIEPDQLLSFLPFFFFFFFFFFVCIHSALIISSPRNWTGNRLYIGNGKRVTGPTSCAISNFAVVSGSFSLGRLGDPRGRVLRDQTDGLPGAGAKYERRRERESEVHAGMRDILRWRVTYWPQCALRYHIGHLEAN